MEQGLSWSERGRIDASTAEATALFQARLLSFWDSLFPAVAPGTNAEHSAFSLLHGSRDSSTVPLQVLLTSHGGSVRQLIQGLVGDRKDHYKVNLVERDPAKLAEGTTRRITNCSITQFELERDAVTGTKLLYSIILALTDACACRVH